MRIDLLISGDVAVKLAALTAASAAVPFDVNDLTRPFLGTGVTTLVAACGGSLGAFAYHAEANRLKLFGVAAANAFLAAALVAVLPLWLGWDWMTPEVKKIAEPPLAFILAFALRWLVPLAVEIGPGWLRRRFGGDAPPGGPP